MDLNYKDVTPIGEHLLIEMDVSEDKIGRIILPDSVKDQKDGGMTTAKILKIGGDAFCDYNKGVPLPVEGEFVICARYCGLRIETKQGNHRICKDQDVIAVIKRS